MEASTIPRQAIVLAAGLGTRLRPITDTTPKPLVSIAGKAMLDWALDALEDIGVSDVFINVHYLADQIERHVAHRQRPVVTISDERSQLLDSGGGIEKILPLMEDKPFFLLNSDTLWLEAAGQSNLLDMACAWNKQQMDILLMLANLDQATGHGTKTDFVRDSAGRLSRSGGSPEGYIYAGVAIVRPEIFSGVARGKHSLNIHFDKAISGGRLYGWPMRGKWITVGTPEAITAAEHVIDQDRALR